jgi:drug/metabolite transporter (DMT)-like permease
MLVLLLVGSGSYGVGSCLGVLLALVTVSMSVGYSVVLRRIPSRYSPLSIVFYVQGVALVLFYVLWGGACLMTSFEPLVDVMEWAPCQLQRAGLSVVYLAVLASVMAFVLFCYTVREIGVTRANVFNNIRPVFTAMLMMLLLGEVLPLWKWVGIVLIIIGLFISQKRIKE